MTPGTSQRLRQTIAYTVRAKDDLRYLSGTKADPSFTVRAKGDRRYLTGTQAGPSLHCEG